MQLFASLLQLLLLISGALVLLSKNPVHSVLFLILVFCNGSALLLLLGLEFLSIIFLVVYVGAIAVLFLFIVMMLNLKIVEFRQSLLNHYPVSLFFLSLFLLEFLSVFPSTFRDGISSLNTESTDWAVLLLAKGNIQLLGELLYTYFYLPFILSGVILLLSMVGSIFLTFSKKEEGRRQLIYSQVVRSSNLNKHG